MSLRRGTAAWVASAALVAAGCGTPAPPTRTARAEVVGASATSALNTISGPLVVAVGDIACPAGSEASATSCGASATAALAQKYQPRRVLTLGDQQYDAGALSAYRGSYAHTWGALKEITKPVAGNHEYRTKGAAGYYAYFRQQQPGAPGYYAFDVGSWRIYGLNTNCRLISCRRENRWLERDLTNHPHRCTAITMHHPRYSSGEHGSNAYVKPFWQTALRHHADLALAGHDHVYERFRRMNAFGSPARYGIASFVVGTGGRSLYDFRPSMTGSMARYNSAFGVLALRLGKTAYSWEYKTIDGAVLDSGTSRCG